jgi:hypothetical protein
MVIWLTGRRDPKLSFALLAWSLKCVVRPVRDETILLSMKPFSVCNADAPK